MPLNDLQPLLQVIQNFPSLDVIALTCLSKNTCSKPNTCYGLAACVTD